MHRPGPEVGSFYSENGQKVTFLNYTAEPQTPNWKPWTAVAFRSVGSGPAGLHGAEEQLVRDLCKEGEAGGVGVPLKVGHDLPDGILGAVPVDEVELRQRLVQGGDVLVLKGVDY